MFTQKQKINLLQSYLCQEILIPLNMLHIYSIKKKHIVH